MKICPSSMSNTSAVRFQSSVFVAKSQHITNCSSCCFNFVITVDIDKPLTGMKLLAVGKLTKNKDDVKAAVEELGGKISGTASKASLCLSTKSK